MTRLVFETSDADKAALAAALQPVGKTYNVVFGSKANSHTLTEISIS